jgi:hypothetical protein
MTKPIGDKRLNTFLDAVKTIPVTWTCLDAVKMIPATWTCCKCKREFDNIPMMGELPEGFEKVPTYPDGPRGTVVYRVGGDICKRCM